MRSAGHSGLAQRKIEGMDMRKMLPMVRKPKMAGKGKEEEARNKALGKAIQAGLLDFVKYLDAQGKPWIPVGIIVFTPYSKTGVAGNLVLNKLGQQFKQELIEVLRQKVAEADEEGTNSDIPF